jgi:putative addiction module component (TIGR02574 family)
MDIGLPLDKMSTSDKLSIMEKLWDDLCKNPDSVPSPEWHKSILASREQDIKNGKATFSSINTVKTRIRDQIK